MGNVCISELSLCLTFKLGILELDTDNGSQALPHIVARQIFICVLEYPVFSAIVIKHSCQSGFEACFVCASVNSMDIVCKREYYFIIAIVISHCHFCSTVFTCGRKMNGLLVHGAKPSAKIEVFHKARKPALIAIGFFDYILAVALIRKCNPQAGV